MVGESYKMDYPHRGRAVIINNRSFDRGTDKDAVALYKRFSEMGFDIRQFEHLCVKDMVQRLYEAASDNEYNRLSDCFMCAILTHGEEGKIEVNELLKLFKGENCKGLVGKPKIVFLEGFPSGQFDAWMGVGVCDVKGLLQMEQVHTIPSDADFLMAYSVFPGYSPAQSIANVSRFIRYLSEVLAKNWRDTDLMTMMIRVNRQVAYDFEQRNYREPMNQKEMIPCIICTLTKKVQFTPKD